MATSGRKKSSTVAADWAAAKEAGQSLDKALKKLATKRKRKRIRYGLRKRAAAIPPPFFGCGVPSVKVTPTKKCGICSACVHKSGPCRLRRCEGKRPEY